MHCLAEVEKLREALKEADVVLVGAGSGLSAAAGFSYSGSRFTRYFSDFIEKYHFTDMYTAGFYPFDSLEEFWGYWSRYIFINRYDGQENGTYRDLFSLVGEKDYFVLTTNVDHQFQKADFSKERLFYTQGDYGLWQCSKPCHQQTYDNEEAVRRMVKEQRGGKVPSALVPYCPKCGAPMQMNLRSDFTFVEDVGWHAAAARYQSFIERHAGARILFLELGVGGNTPGIIKYPFWQMALKDPFSTYACIDLENALCPRELESRAICIEEDIAAVLKKLQSGR